MSLNQYDFYAMFENKNAAVEYRKRQLYAVLDLPKHAEAVRDGGLAAATPEFWVWLCNRAMQDGHRP